MADAPPPKPPPMLPAGGYPSVPVGGNYPPVPADYPTSKKPARRKVSSLGPSGGYESVPKKPRKAPAVEERPVEIEEDFSDVLPVRYGDERLAAATQLEFELPRGATTKFLKNQVEALSPGPAFVDEEVIANVARAGGLFAWYVTKGATEFALASKRQTISAQDVLYSLQALNFGDDNVQACADFLERDRARRPKRDTGDQKKFRGVYKGSVNAWYSQISIAGQPIHLGSFAEPEAAAKAYDRAIWSKLGAAAATLLNFPEEIPESLPHLLASTRDGAPPKGDKRGTNGGYPRTGKPK